MADFLSELLAHVFQNADVPELGDAIGLRGSSAAGSLFVSLHTSDPGETGNQASFETSYTGYGRVQLARSVGSFDITGRTVAFHANVEFPVCTGGTPLITHFGLGVAVAGAGKLLYSGPLTPQMQLGPGRIPILSTATTITEGGPAQTIVQGLGLSAALASATAAGQAISGGPVGSRYYPRATTTGPASGTVFTNRTTQLTAVAGQTIQGLNLTNRLIVPAGANNVTVEDSIISTQAFSCVQITKGVTGFTMRRCLIDGNYNTVNPIGGNGTFIECDIRRGENAYNGEGWIPIVIQGCYFHDFIKNQNYAGHRDGIQIFGETDGTGFMTARIEQTTVLMDGTPFGNTALYTANTFGPLNGVPWRNCYGYSSGGGYTASFQDGSPSGYRMQGVSWRDCYIVGGYAGNGTGYLYESNPGTSGDEPDFYNGTNLLIPQGQQVAVENAPWLVNGVQMPQDTPPPH